MCAAVGTVIDVSSQRFFQLIKALVRFNYSEWDYNIHWGGDTYESLFYGENNIFFDQGRSVSNDVYEEIVLCITEGPVYEDYDKGVSVFAGYGAEGMQNPLLVSLKADLDHGLIKISELLKTENHFKLEADVKAVIEKYSEIAAIGFDQDQRLYRARVGFKEVRRDMSFGFEAKFQYVPYTGSDIGAPPPFIAQSGRANRAGVSFLYCATDRYTSVAEVRPHPGDRVTIAEFRVNRKISMFDLSDSKLLNYFENDQKLDEYKSFNTLGVFLNRTIPPAERAYYSITQLIADCIRQLGFDGVLFNSTVGSGKNAVLFDQTLVDLLPEESEVVLVGAVQYRYQTEDSVIDDGTG